MRLVNAAHKGLATDLTDERRAFGDKAIVEAEENEEHVRVRDGRVFEEADRRGIVLGAVGRIMRAETEQLAKVRRLQRRKI
jgi:hypothetical protein